MKKQSPYQNKRDSEALAEALMDLPENWLMCRDMRHAWQIQEDFHVEKNKGKTAQTVKRTLTCLRCSTLRTEHYLMERLGLNKVAQNYTYPEDYQMKGIPRGNKPSSIIQGEQFRRTMEKVAQAQGAGLKAVKSV